MSPDESDTEFLAEDLLIHGREFVFDSVEPETDTPVQKNHARVFQSVPEELFIEVPYAQKSDLVIDSREVERGG